MGTWRIETCLYGEQERWLPDYRGEWPADAPTPCEVCMGELTRRTVYPESGRLANERRLAELAAARARRVGLVPAPIPEPSLGRPVVRYDVACYRSTHGWAKAKGGDSRSPALVGTLPALTAPMRTGDWTERD